MTPEEIGNLTLADLEAIGARFKTALDTIRQAQSLLGGRPAEVPVSTLPPRPPTRTHTPLAPGEAEEMAAQRDALVRQNRPDEYPPSMADVMGGPG